VIGVGNALRGDDGAGLEVARRLHDEPGLTVREHEGEGLDLLTLWEGAGSVVLVDAMSSGAAPGAVTRFDATRAAPPAVLRRRAGHAVGVAEAIELARSLGRLPDEVVIVGIEGGSFALGAGLSAEVAAALDTAADAVRREL
jgi:hydrogenase maturation protease